MSPTNKVNRWLGTAAASSAEKDNGDEKMMTFVQVFVLAALPFRTIKGLYKLGFP